MTNPATLQQRLNNLHGGPYWAPTGFGEWLYYWAARPKKKWTRRGEIIKRVRDRIFADLISRSDEFTPFPNVEAVRDFLGTDLRECDGPILAALKAEHKEFWRARGERVIS